MGQVKRADPEIVAMVEYAFAPERIETRYGLKSTGTISGGPYVFLKHAHLVDGVLYDGDGFKVPRDKFYTYPSGYQDRKACYKPHRTGPVELHWAEVKERALSRTLAALA